MPIKLPSTLPAYSILANEGVMVIDDELAAYQDIRPLKIGLLNLMPKKNSNRNSICSANRRYTTSN